MVTSSAWHFFCSTYLNADKQEIGDAFSGVTEEFKTKAYSFY